MTISCAGAAAAPTLGVSMAHSGNATQGGSFAYSITASVSVAATTSATLTAAFTLPAGVTYSSASGSGWSCSGTGQSGSCTRTTEITVVAEPTITLNVDVAINAATRVTPSVTLSGGGASNTPTASDATIVRQIAASVAINAGNNQSATVGAAFASSLQVVVKDAASVVIPGATVTFAGPGSGAGVTFPGGSSTSTNASGIATISVSANATAGGPYTVSAQAGSVSANFSLTNKAAAVTVTGLSKTSGPATGGTFLTISGTGFTGATAVKFGATSGTGITVVSATQITVTAPAGRAGTVDITVTTPGGTSVTSASDQFTYVAVPVLRTWVSGTGNDANDCSRGAPCLTFAGAFANTLAGGEINCVDGADYGRVTITRAVAIVCDAAGAHVLVGNGDGIVVNAGASDAVTLSGLDISTNPGNLGITPLSGIKLLSAGSLTIANTQLRGFTGSYAVENVPTAPLVSVLLDRVSVARSPGSTGASMLVSPASGGTARVSILHSRFDASRAPGVHFDSVGKTGVTIAALIQDSLFVSNYAGLVATAPVGTGTTTLTVLGTTFSRNSNAAIIIGAVTALFGNSTISTNGSGLVVQDGAVVRSAGDNRLGGNTYDGAFTSQRGAVAIP
ncbi:IPT/TIG domain-containing protein [Sphingomonas sp. AR_OL41]|uniref:IPT/TIG domain-containing protein n=1 Tax=Sphingomonas sp. AR_OL41 TaxID=3042729 RepID=UPI0024807F8B|nr:IPT/TIG domain-containing protein [Sphingomonas sp. AR_OL41]MDH7974987.1 IPT/TIG domain-containing protein [Sphingomonas sp. AR_OL41]